MGWTLSPKTTPPAAWMLMATGYAGRPCSGAGPNGTIRTARASGVLWPDHSPARRLPRPRGVTPMTHPRLDSDDVQRLPHPRVLRLALAPGRNSDGATRTGTSAAEPASRPTGVMWASGRLGSPAAHLPHWDRASPSLVRPTTPASRARPEPEWVKYYTGSEMGSYFRPTLVITQITGVGPPVRSNSLPTGWANTNSQKFS